MNRLTYLTFLFFSVGATAIGSCRTDPLGNVQKLDAGAPADAGGNDSASPARDTAACGVLECGPAPTPAPCPDGSNRSFSTCTLQAGRCVWQAGQCPVPDAGRSCGDNPAQVCRAPGRCVPSNCVCDPNRGSWACTQDCGGGRDCLDGGTVMGPDPRCAFEQPPAAGCQCRLNGWICSPCGDSCGMPPNVVPRCANGNVGSWTCSQGLAGHCGWKEGCPAATDCTAQECGTPPPVTTMCPGGGVPRNLCDRDGASGQCGWQTACTCAVNQCPAGPPVVCPDGSDAYFCGRNGDGGGSCRLIRRSCVGR
jgi:hypothetical protein